MAAIPVNFITSPEDPRIGAIACPVPYIRRRVLDYLRQYPEVEKCGRVSLLDHAIYFRVREGHAAANTAYKIHITFPMFIAAISLLNYTIGIRHENALLAYVRERCIEEIKIRFTKEKTL